MSTELRRVLKAFLYAFRGLKTAYRHQIAFRLQTLLLIVGVPVAFILKNTASDRLWLISAIMLILFAEVVNSAIEMVVDRISLQRNVLSKHAKDLGSAAVLIAVIHAVIVWCVILLA